MNGEPKFKFDLQGLIRTGITIGAMVFGYCQIISSINDKVADNKKEISVLRQNIETHKKSTKIYTLDELTDRFVTRREWESNHKALRDDMLYIRKKIDTIYDRVIDKK
jgi:hypothetical protein